MKTKYIAVIITFFASLLFSAAPVYAQDNEYTVRLRRDFGYSWGNDIQGTLSIMLNGDEQKVGKVTFYIDDSILSVVDSSPFRYQFNTDEFNVGSHQLYAEVQLTDGTTQMTPALIYNFIDSKSSNQQLVKILVGIGGSMLAVFAIVAIIQGVMMKGNKRNSHEPGTPRSYGLLGGTICPKCGRPFPRHIWGIKLIVGRLDRCENCGKWVMTNRATPEALRMAEEVELEAEKADEIEAVPPLKEHEDLEETKYIDNL